MARTRQAEILEAEKFVADCRAVKLRGMREFAEQEIWIPDGDYEGQRYRVDRQPAIGPWFDAIDLGFWNEYVGTAPSQSGKSLGMFVIPICYHLFEYQETVICGLPMMEMAEEKWNIDIFPVIERTRYRELLPRTGRGSRNGFSETIRFRNGATLKFMSGGGSDKRRAHFTARVLVITETDDLDTIGELSAEPSKIEQMEARLRHYDERKRIYKECTVSRDTGHTWRRLKSGTDTHLYLPCPHCKQHVLPERQHLKGWEGAADEIEARDKSHWHCPACDKPWTNEQRIEAIRHGVALHRGQSIVAGEVRGDMPRTLTFGYRYSAVHNLFAKPGSVGMEEYKAPRDKDPDNKERELCLFVHAMPYDSPHLEIRRLDPDTLAKRKRTWPQNIIPPETDFLTVGVDVGQYRLHWVMIAWLRRRICHVPAYGRVDVRQSIEFAQALYDALTELRDYLERGWTGSDSSEYLPNQVWIDARWQKKAKTDQTILPVYEFCAEFADENVYRPALGFGTGQYMTRYRKPTGITQRITHIGMDHHIEWNQAAGIYVAHVNVDSWKTRLNGFLSLDAIGNVAGSMSFYESADVTEHDTITRHLCAEHAEEIFVPGKGEELHWIRDSKANHFLDATMLACAAADFCGWSTAEDYDGPPPQEEDVGSHPISELATPSGESYFATDR